MKTFALVLFCVVVAAQGRSTGPNDVKWTPAEAGMAPWLVHLRVATENSGLLSTCAASLIQPNFLLTSATCVKDARFIWSRFGAVEVIRPELVLETNPTGASIIPVPETDIVLINLGRDVQYTDNVFAAVVPTEEIEVPHSGSFCAYGQNESGGPGEQVRCIEVTLKTEDRHFIIATSEHGEASSFDTGAPLVVNGIQYGVLVDPATFKFVNIAVPIQLMASSAILPYGEESQGSAQLQKPAEFKEDQEVDPVHFVN